MHADAQTRTILKLMSDSAQRGAAIVRQVLGFVRGLEENRGEIQIRHIMREIEQILTRTLPKSIEIETRVPRDLWTVLGDGNQLHQVLMNLCVNARDAMPEGGKLTLVAENLGMDEEYARGRLAARPIAYVRIMVEDTDWNPPGAEGQDLRSFLHDKGSGQGHGSGAFHLPFHREELRRVIDVDTAVGKGSIFNVFLPAVTQPSIEREDEDEAIPLGKNEMILVVDDESGVREITRQTLQSYGYTVVTAQDGAEAVALFAEKKAQIRAVITDIMMPIMDGAATVRALRRMSPRLKIIAMSGLLSAQDGKGMNGLRLQAFLAKPFTAQMLLKTLSGVLDAED